MLGNGASAGDAAAAMYFTMAVTLPSRVGLAGDGVCIGFDSGKVTEEDPKGTAYQFLSAATAGVPTGPRAMATLHARLGLMRWEEVIAPAENLARFGQGVSRALAQDIALASQKISRSPDLRRSLSNQSGDLAREGDRIVQDELSAVLGGIRRRGAEYLHNGSFAERLSSSATTVGWPLTRAALREGRPQVGGALRLAYGRDFVYLPPPPAQGGLATAQLWEILTDLKNYDRGDAERRHLLAEVSARVNAGRAGWGGLSTARAQSLLSDAALEALIAGYDSGRHSAPAGAAAPLESNPFGAGFVVADRWGQSVACSFTQNALFGSGEVVPGTGLLLPAPAAPGAAGLTPMIIGNENTGDLRYASAANGGLAGPVAAIAVALEATLVGQPLQSAIAAPRVVHVGAPDVTWHEPELPAAAKQSLAGRGHNLREAPGLGGVNALYCTQGLLGGGESCDVATDPRGFGLAARAQ